SDTQQAPRQTGSPTATFHKNPRSAIRSGVLFFWLKRPVPNTSRITACTALSPPTVTPVPTGDLAALPPRSHHPNDRLASAGRHLPPAHKELPDMNASAQLAARNMPAAARRIAQPLPSPALLRQRLPLEHTLAAHVHAQRQAI